ncbi:CDP-glycerol:glycerophosphate glycerophosphotransferase [Methanobrevibacter gottschalkii]|uniref:CDP-glycerol:glycerophosphate glycerophosphotransferase n=1 Tax=Methanobrevibacter gottschalkii TaxID=190974 RepID=UPI00117F75BA|nr:CDP-glycerol glycerophosphotransferase family protein [Methanobrevibacter gottschalkii]
MDEIEFSVIIPTHNSELGIKKSIDSILNQTLNFENNIEIIIVDNNSEDKTQDICYDYISKYPKNISYIQLDTVNMHKSKNTAMKHAYGKFITFLKPHDYLSKDSLSHLLKFINTHENIDLAILPIFYYKNNRKERYINYKIKNNKKINLIEQPQYSQLIGLSTFFKKESIKNIEFLDTTNENITFFSEMLINNPYLGICSKGAYFAKNIEERIYPSDTTIYSTKEYEKFIKYNFNNLKNKCFNKFSKIPEFIQFSFISHLRWLLSIKKTEEKIDLKSLIDTISYINNDILLENRLLKEELTINTFLLKYNNDLSNDLMEKLDLNTLFIDIYDIIDNKIHILANIKNITTEDIDILVNNKKIKFKKLTFPHKYAPSLGYNLLQDYSIECIIPIKTDKKFKLEFKQKDKLLHIDFSRPCNFSKSVGYAKTKHYLSILKDDHISIEKKTTLKWIKQELKSLKNMFKNHEPGFIKAVPFRVAYMISYPFLRNKKIWFFMDRPDEADDNGLALFKYAVKQEDDINKYFIINSKNNESNNIKNIGKVIGYKSPKHRFLGMFVENIITSHPDNGIIYPFWGGYPFFAGLLKSNTMFLQHGVAKDDISYWVNKANMNLSLFLTSTIQEYESILENPYHYDDYVVQLIGLPRFDNLKNQEDKKQILIMPSWRRDLDHKSEEYIKKNEFFKKFNSLINNKRLIEVARENNYEIIFKPHPNVYNFIDLFDENDYIKIDYEKTEYQELFNSGSLAVTDYSSIAFDFAYLHKPVIYYHYTNDYHFNLDESYFNYETMGFGEVVKKEDELINLIIEYIENDCKIKEKYSNRIKNTFKFNDKNNCKRAYDRIKEIKLKD